MLEFLKKHKWPILAILLFLIFSYFFISSDYHFIHGDAGAFAMYAKKLYETNKIDTSGAATALIGQLLFSNLFCKIFGFNLKNLRVSIYIVNFLSLIAMYLLLSELGVDRFLAFFGSLALFINPVSIKMIDWYMTEPFFMFYLISSLLFFIKGLRVERYRLFYIGSIFCILAILTRQHAISVPISLFFLCLFYKKYFQKGIFNHCIISSILPIIAIVLYYLYVFFVKNSQGRVPYAYAPENIAIIKRFLNPLYLFFRLYFDSLFFLHYIPLYLTPLLLILLFSLLRKPKKIKDFNFYISIFSILFISIGTIILYAKNNRLMPYLPSIFSVNSLTKIFDFTILKKDTASFVLTVFTWIGAIMILIKILEYFLAHTFIKDSLNKKSNPKNKKKRIKMRDNRIDFGEKFIYLWGIFYILVTIFVGLRYERYIFPISVLMIYVILSNFKWIKEYKKMFIVIFTMLYFIVIFNVISYGFSVDLEWKANHFLIQQGIPYCQIRGGLGFSNYYCFDYINDLYKNVKIKRPINWQKFHPMARFFVTGKSGLEKTHPGLDLYDSFHKKRLFGFIENKKFIYKRKKGYKKAIWL